MPEDRTTVTGSMNDSDALLWRIGRDPILRTTIVAVLVLDRAPRFDEVRTRVATVAGSVARLHSRLQPAPLGWGRPRWVADDGFDIDLHLRRLVAPPPGTLRTVLDLAQAMGTVECDPALPLWEAVVVEGLEGGGAALVIKLHHAVSDGVGGLAVAQQLLDRRRRPRPYEVPAEGDGPAAARGAPEPGSPACVRTLPAAVAAPARRVAGVVARAVVDPVGQLELARDSARSVGRLLAPAGAPLSPLLTPRSVRRRYEVLDLDRKVLQELTAASHVTINDVFVSGVLLGMRRYHGAHGVALDRLRVLMPVNVRTALHPLGGNHFVPARFVLPVPADPERCLRKVHDVAGSWKAAPALGMSDVLAALLDLLPPPLVSRVWGSMLKGDDFVATNVPGPPFETYLAGARVEHFYAFAPPSGSALNVALVTPARRACIGVSLDAAAVPDPSTFVGCLREGFAEVLALGGGSTRASA